MLRLLPLSLLATIAFSTSAAAGPISVDFSTLSGGTVTDLGTGSTTLNGVTAQAYYFPGSWTATNLIARNEPTIDLGLGVCNPNETSNCNIGGTGGGDWNELSQLENNEAILLSLNPLYDWTGLWVSSLDSGGADVDNTGPDTSAEEGRVCWGNTNNLTTLLGGSCFDFNFGDFGASVNGDLFALSAFTSVFDATSQYVVFVPKPSSVGDNNDYLVWGVDWRQGTFDQPVPEPASLTLLGLGLGAARLLRRRRRT